MLCGVGCGLGDSVARVAHGVAPGPVDAPVRWRERVSTVLTSLSSDRRSEALELRRRAPSRHSPRRRSV